MDLKKKDIGELLTLSEQTIDRLLEEGKIPHYKLGGEYRFNRQEIENWMMQTLSSDKEGLPFGEVRGESGPWQQFGLYRALHKGQVLTLDSEGKSKKEIIEETTFSVASRLSFDAEMIADLLYERELLQSTALASGIAVPHTREVLLRNLYDAVIVVYLTTPMDWGALDGEEVSTLFFLFACDDKRHLNLLAKIAHFSSSPDNIAFLKHRPGKEELLTHVKAWESLCSYAMARG